MIRKQLFKKIDIARREYVRKRDTNHEGYAECISCNVYRPVEEMDAGHYYRRGHDWSTKLGDDFRNVNLQCVPCNSFKRGNLQGYAVGLLKKYGKDVIMELENKKNTEKYWKLKELNNLLEMYKHV